MWIRERRHARELSVLHDKLKNEIFVGFLGEELTTVTVRQIPASIRMIPNGWHFELHHDKRRSRGSSVSIVSDYGLDDRSLIPDRGRGFSSSLCVQAGSGAHPASCTMGTRGPFTGGKARPGRDADHSPPSSAEVKNE
jgi:hypothetical protein